MKQVDSFVSIVDKHRKYVDDCARSLTRENHTAKRGYYVESFASRRKRRENVIGRYRRSWRSMFREKSSFFHDDRGHASSIVSVKRIRGGGGGGKEETSFSSRPRFISFHFVKDERYVVDVASSPGIIGLRALRAYSSRSCTPAH